MTEKRLYYVDTDTYFYYIASGTYCHGSEFKCLVSDAKRLTIDENNKTPHHTKPNPKPTL